MAAGHEQHDDRQFDLRILEKCCVEVGLEMVDGHEGHVPHEREGLGRAHADEERTDETGTDGGGHGVDMVVGDARLDECSGDDGSEQFDVRPAGDLGHHATEAGMEFNLARHHRGEHLMAVHDDGGRGLVTAGLDSEDSGAVHQFGPSVGS